MLRRVAAFCRPLRPVLLLVSFPRSRSPVVGVLGLCWMWHGVPFACQRRSTIGVLRMCWLLLGSFDCFCCPHTSVHRPSIACLAVFLCGRGALFLHALSGPSTICPFPRHGWSAPDGLLLLLRKQPIWAAGDTPHLMPVEQGIPPSPALLHPLSVAGQRVLARLEVEGSGKWASPHAPLRPQPRVVLRSAHVYIVCPNGRQLEGTAGSLGSSKVPDAGEICQQGRSEAGARSCWARHVPWACGVRGGLRVSVFVSCTVCLCFGLTFLCPVQTHQCLTPHLCMSEAQNSIGGVKHAKKPPPKGTPRTPWGVGVLHHPCR